MSTKKNMKCPNCKDATYASKVFGTKKKKVGKNKYLCPICGHTFIVK